MRVYHDEDADLGLLKGRRIAVIGYGNQGRAQALNLRDSGLDVLVGNKGDEYAERAREDGFPVFSIPEAVAQTDIVVLLIPDEVMPHVFGDEIAPHLKEGDALVFASGYNIAFDFIQPPAFVDVMLVAPRMIGSGVRDLYVAGRGFPSFIGVGQDYSGRARGIALAIARGIGSTRAGVVEVTLAQEAELDLFTEQCFGPAFGRVLTTAVSLLIDEGYPPEAVLLEVYMSGELSYTLGKIAEMGIVEQSVLHSRTSQYGSMSRGMRFNLPELRDRMLDGLEEIRSGRFAEEWAAEQVEGCPTLEALRQAALSLPLRQVEQELRRSLTSLSTAQQVYAQSEESERATEATHTEITPAPPQEAGVLKRLWGRVRGASSEAASPAMLSSTQVEEVLRAFLAHVVDDQALRKFARDRQMTTHYVLHDPELEFYIRFEDDGVTADLGAPASPAEVRLETKAEVLDGMLTGRIHAMRAAMSGRLSFSGEAKLAIAIQKIQDDLCRLYTEVRDEVKKRRS